MPRGGARTGAGRPRKPIGVHLAQGTYRADRHGPRPTNVVLMPAVPEAWTPSAADVAGLGASGRRLMTDILARYEPTTVEGFQLLEAARAADVLASLRAAEAPDLRQLRLWSAHYTLTLRMLGLSA